MDENAYLNIKSDRELGPRIQFSRAVRHRFMMRLGRKYQADKLNDELISKFIITLSEHTDIVNYSSDLESQNKKLLQTLQLCSEKKLSDICFIANNLDMPDVAKLLDSERHKDRKCEKRRNTDNLGQYHSEVTQSQVKRQMLSHPDIAENQQLIKEKTEEHLGFQVMSVTSGSLLIKMKPKNEQSWEILMKKCCSGEIKDYFAEILKNELAKFGVGDYLLDVNIYTLHDISHSKDHVDADEALIVIDSKFQISKECSDILCEELEITEDLLSVLKSENVVDEDIDRQLKKIDKREDQTQYLLSNVEKYAKKGYDVLKEFVKDYDCDVFKDLMATEDGDDTTKRMTKVLETDDPQPKVKKSFYKATLVLRVDMKEKRDETESEATLNFEIIHTDILDTCCFFKTGKYGRHSLEEGGTASDLSEEWKHETINM